MSSDRLRSHLAVPMFARGYLLVLNQGLAAVLGLAYWIIAARTYAVEDVGRQAAVISTLLFVAYVSQLGLKTTMTWYLPTAAATAARRFIRNGYLVSAALALVLASLAVTWSGSWSDGVLDDPVLRAAFVGGAVVWCIFNIQDGVLTGLRLTSIVPIENFAFNVMKLAAMVALAGVSPRAGIVWSWIVPLVPCVIAVNWIVARRPITTVATVSTGDDTTRRTIRVAALDFLGGAASEAAIRLLPVIVVIGVSSESGAYFTQAWALSAPLLLIAGALTASMTVETSGAIDGGHRDVLAMRRLVLRIVVPAALALALTAPWVLRLFGERYAAEGVGALRLLALSAVPGAITVWGIAVARARRRGSAIVRIQLLVLVVTLGTTAALLSPLGVLAPAIGWTAAQTIAALLTLVRFRRTEAVHSGPHDRSADIDHVGPMIAAAATSLPGGDSAEEFEASPRSSRPCGPTEALSQLMRRESRRTHRIHVGIPRATPRAWVPITGGRFARRHLITAGRVPRGMRRLGSWAIVALGSVGMLGPLVRTDHRDGDVDLLILAGGQRPNNKLIGLAFGRGRMPHAVIKRARVAESKREIANEIAMLDAAPDALRAPRLIGADDAHQPKWFTQEMLRGESGDRLCTDDRYAELAERGLTWSLDAAANSEPDLLWGPPEARELITSLQRAWGNRAELAAATAALSFAPLPAVIAHGDLTPWNIVVHQESIRAFDWESGRLRGSAGADLVYLLTTAACSAQPSRAPHAVYADLIHGVGTYGDVFGRTMTDYLRALSVPSSDEPAVRLATWLFHADLEVRWRDLVESDYPADGGFCLGMIAVEFGLDTRLSGPDNSRASV